MYNKLSENFLWTENLWLKEAKENIELITAILKNCQEDIKFYYWAKQNKHENWKLKTDQKISIQKQSKILTHKKSQWPESFSFINILNKISHLYIRRSRDWWRHLTQCLHSYFSRNVSQRLAVFDKLIISKQMFSSQWAEDIAITCRIFSKNLVELLKGRNIFMKCQMQTKWHDCNLQPLIFFNKLVNAGFTCISEK